MVYDTNVNNINLDRKVVMKLTLKEEQQQWLANYELLLKQMQAAYRFKNITAIASLEKRILTTQVQIASVTRQLEKDGNTDPKGGVRAGISRYVKVANNPPVSFDSVDRYWSE